MLTPKEIKQLEYTLVDDYLDEIQTKKYPSEVIHGDIQVWTDADEYQTYPGSCTASGDTIKGWLIDNFDSLIDEFLRKSGNKQSLSELASKEVLQDRSTYMEFVWDTLDAIEQYFWSSDRFSELCDEYFQNNGERDY